MLSFPSQNDKIFFPTGRVYSKKQTWVTANQYVFKSGLKKKFLFSRKENVSEVALHFSNRLYYDHARISA